MAFLVGYKLIRRTSNCIQHPKFNNSTHNNYDKDHCGDFAIFFPSHFSETVILASGYKADFNVCGPDCMSLALNSIHQFIS